MLGDCMRGVFRNSNHGQTQLGCCCEIDLIESGATQRDDAYAQLFEYLQRDGAQVVIDETAHGVAPLRQSRCSRFEPRFEEDDLVSERFVGSLEIAALEWMGIEKSNTHWSATRG
jgi:hypothetical protein